MTECRGVPGRPRRAQRLRPPDRIARPRPDGRDAARTEAFARIDVPADLAAPAGFLDFTGFGRFAAGAALVAFAAFGAGFGFVGRTGFATRFGFRAAGFDAFAAARAARADVRAPLAFARSGPAGFARDAFARAVRAARAARGRGAPSNASVACPHRSSSPRASSR
jgi:hypothetical protein